MFMRRCEMFSECYETFMRRGERFRRCGESFVGWIEALDEQIERFTE